jgi:hypothetical protein
MSVVWFAELIRRKGCGAAGNAKVLGEAIPALRVGSDGEGVEVLLISWCVPSLMSRGGSGCSMLPSQVCSAPACRVVAILD